MRVLVAFALIAALATVALSSPAGLDWLYPDDLTPAASTAVVDVDNSPMATMMMMMISNGILEPLHEHSSSSNGGSSSNSNTYNNGNNNDNNNNYNKRNLQVTTPLPAGLASDDDSNEK